MADLEQRMTLKTRLRFLILAGVGLFSDGYLNIVIGLGEALSPSSPELY